MKAFFAHCQSKKEVAGEPNQIMNTADEDMNEYKGLEKLKG